MSNALNKLRLQAELTMQELADLAGTTAPQINKLEKGYRDLDKKWALRLAPYLGVTAEELMFPRKAAYAQSSPAYRQLQDAAVYGLVSVRAKSYGINEESVISRRPRHPELMGQNGFYITVTGTEMEPLFDEGHILSVNPDLPLVKGKPCLIETINNEALVRKFVARTAQSLTFEQLNPRKKQTIKLKELIRVSRVVGQEF